MTARKINRASVEVKLDISSEYPDVAEVEQFLADAKSHGAKGDTVVEVDDYALKVTL